MQFKPRRSALYMPGSNARALEKAKSLAADVLILDLEDSVVPAAKAEARQLVAKAVREGGYGQSELVVRLNATQSDWGVEDLVTIAPLGPHAILVPKVSSPGEIMMVAKALREAGAPERTRLWAMIETPLAILNIDAIARASADPMSRLDVFVIGTNDLAKETRARLVPGRVPMLAWLSMCIAAARAHGVEVLDGVYNDIANAAGFREECQQGLEFGMDGKTLIHPSQVAVCNEIFAPSIAEIAWAKSIVTAFASPENAGKGAIQLDGRMVERLHAEMAERTVSVAQAIAMRETA
ncbi:MAG: CoA ester lyase [Hyphomicrobiales bacterium]|nr:CoA ester lyase [Hyphomicrobiales bacterium]MDE2113568.1 CoA ester lyase [Hyphomicrobiales bacterium]